MTSIRSKPQAHRIVLITGPSGAGRSTAINALEDIGYEAIDNIPLTLIPRLLEGSDRLERPLVLGIDARNREFSAEALLDLYEELGQHSMLAPELVYIDCLPRVLERRFSETRRRHPLAPDEAPDEGIAREMHLLRTVRLHADVLIDTTELTVHDLRAAIERRFSDADAAHMAVSVQSFSYKRGLPQSLDFAFDCRFLRNPHWEPALRSHTGLSADVAAYVARDPRLSPYLDHVLTVLQFVLPEAEKEGKAHLSIGFGCTGGKHRSVAVTQTVAAALAQEGRPVSIRHRELERMGIVPHPVQALSETGKASL